MMNASFVKIKNINIFIIIFFYRNVAKDSDQSANVNVKNEHHASSSVQPSTQKSKKVKERSTTQVYF